MKQIIIDMQNLDIEEPDEFMTKIMKKLNLNKYRQIFENETRNSSPETFNRLRDLQNLIKKESALKELCN